MPTISGIADQAATSDRPSFARDFCAIVLPCLNLRSEFRRVSAHIDDTIIRLRSQRLEVEVMRQRRAQLPFPAPKPRRIEALVNPRTYLSENQQFLDNDELEMLRHVGKKKAHPYLYLPGPVMPTHGCPIGSVMGSSRRLPDFPESGKTRGGKQRDSTSCTATRRRRRAHHPN